MHSPPLIDVVRRFTASLDEQGIAWCVLRNYETFPHPRSDTSDLDIMLGCKPEQALAIFRAEVNSPVGIGKVVVSRSDDLISFFPLPFFCRRANEPSGHTSSPVDLY